MPGAKVACPYGPSAGDEGFRKNVEFFAGWREKVGPDFPLSLDCYMALTVPYSIKLGKALAEYNIKWMEEFLPPGEPNKYTPSLKPAKNDQPNGTEPNDMNSS
jgi:L-rhamnonate dehydratase|eukprot:SAG11_NODE_404_length_9736_cov_20.243022_6_plen_103_part_00